MSSFFRVICFIGDLLFLNVSVILSYSITLAEFTNSEWVNIIYLLIFSNLTWLFLLAVSNPYNFARNWGARKFIINQVSYVIVHLFVVAFLIFFFKKSYSPLQIGVMYLIFVPLFFGWKFLALFLIASFSGKRVIVKNMIIIGENNLVREVRRYFLMHPEMNYRFQGSFAFNHNLNLDELSQFCDKRNVHEIFYCIPDMDEVALKGLVDFSLNRFIKMKLINNFDIGVKSDFSFDRDENVFMKDRQVVPLDEVGNQILKRAFDLIFGGLVLIFVMSWLLPLIGLLIKLDSRGPIFFRQKRGGLNNRAFDCIKFRTMVLNAESEERQATKDDARITKLGKFLRKSSLDEFPQVLNVLAGDMSLIGPRPHPLKLNEKFALKIEGLMSRHYVKPGITGLAQSMGYRGETKDVLDMQNRFEMDRFYIENWSISLDIKIVIRTVISLIKGSENAY